MRHHRCLGGVVLVLVGSGAAVACASFSQGSDGAPTAPDGSVDERTGPVSDGGGGPIEQDEDADASPPGPSLVDLLADCDEAKPSDASCDAGDLCPDFSRGDALSDWSPVASNGHAQVSGGRLEVAVTYPGGYAYFSKTLAVAPRAWSLCLRYDVTVDEPPQYSEPLPLVMLTGTSGDPTATLAVGPVVGADGVLLAALRLRQLPSPDGGAVISDSLGSGTAVPHHVALVMRAPGLTNPDGEVALEVDGTVRVADPLRPLTGSAYVEAYLGITSSLELFSYAISNVVVRYRSR